MTNYQKIEKNICLYCDGKLVDVPNCDKKNCSVCESHYWFRDDDNSWRNNKSEKLIKQELSLEFRDIISHALLGSDTENISKETWNLVFDECAKYTFGLLNVKTKS